MATATTKKKKTSRKAPPSGKGLTYEKVWAMLQETNRILNEDALRREKDYERWERDYERREKDYERRERDYEKQKEATRKLEENFKQNVREMRESSERLDKKLDKQFGRFGNRLGEIIEYMVMPNIVQKFNELGYEFIKAYPHAIIKDKINNIYTEVDITLENGDKVMLVEVKSKPTTEDISEHIKRMEKIKLHANLHGDKRTFLGAFAGMVFNDNEKLFALKNGFYVIEPSGETFIITVPEGEYAPREW